MNTIQKYRKLWKTKPIDEIVNEIDRLVVKRELERNPLIRASLWQRINTLEAIERDRQNGATMTIE